MIILVWQCLQEIGMGKFWGIVLMVQFSSGMFQSYEKQWTVKLWLRIDTAQAEWPVPYSITYYDLNGTRVNIFRPHCHICKNVTEKKTLPNI